MQFVKRFFFLILTNIAVLALISVIMMVLNIFFPQIMDAAGGNLQLFIFSALIGFVGAFISLMISRWIAKRTYNITLIDAESSLRNEKISVVWNTVSCIAQEHKLCMPEVGYYESPDPNAFATGATKNSALVAVSTGLLDQMNIGEIEGVVGHEMAHVINGDMVTLTLIQGIINTFVVFLSYIVAQFISKVILKDEDGGDFIYSIIVILLQIVFGALASLVVMWFSRIREYRADAGGAKFTSTEKMIAGLQRLQEFSRGSSIKNPKAKEMAAFMIYEKDSMFSTHPSIENRIKALRGY